MSVIEVKVVVRSVNICGDNGNVLAIVLFVVCISLDMGHTFGVGVCVVGVVGWSEVEVVFVDWVFNLVGEDAGG